MKTSNRLLFMLSMVLMISITSCGDQKGKGSDDGNAGTHASGNGVIALNGEEFKKRVWDFEAHPGEWKYKGDLPAVIDFYADWCAPCKIAAPIMEELAAKYKGKVVFYKVDTDKERELAGIFGIRTIPSFLFIPAIGEPELTSGIAPGEEATRKMFTDMVEQKCLGNFSTE